MFGIYEMIHFIKMTPFYMVLVFFTSFTLTKLAQSERVYTLASSALTQSRHKKRQKLMAEMRIDIQTLLYGRKEEDLSKDERKILQVMRRGYYEDLGNLYSKGDDDGRK